MLVGSVYKGNKGTIWDTATSVTYLRHAPNNEQRNVVTNIIFTNTFLGLLFRQPCRVRRLTMALLPPVPGPKTGPFTTSGPVDFVFLQKLGGGADATVYKIKLQGRIYSLKVVCAGPHQPMESNSKANEFTVVRI